MIRGLGLECCSSFSSSARRRLSQPGHQRPCQTDEIRAATIDRFAPKCDSHARLPGMERFTGWIEGSASKAKPSSVRTKGNRTSFMPIWMRHVSRGATSRSARSSSGVAQVGRRYFSLERDVRVRGCSHNERAATREATGSFRIWHCGKQRHTQQLLNEPRQRIHQWKGFDRLQ